MLQVDPNLSQFQIKRAMIDIACHLVFFSRIFYLVIVTCELTINSITKFSTALRGAFLGISVLIEFRGVSKLGPYCVIYCPFFLYLLI